MGKERLMTAAEWEEMQNLKNKLHNCRQHTKFKLQQVINDIKKYTSFKDVYELGQLVSYIEIKALAAEDFDTDKVKELHLSNLLIWANTWVALHEIQYKEDLTLEDLKGAYKDYITVEKAMNASEVQVVGIFTSIGYFQPQLN